MNRWTGAAPAAIGISACGPIDHRRGAIVRPPNLPFAEIPLVDPLGDEFGVPVRLANDCHAGVLGEVAFGAGAGCRDLVYITLSTGIGGGVVSNGRLILGRDGNAAEIGHLHVDDRYSLPCGCGGTGHWEGYASGRFLPRFFARWCELSGCPPGDAAPSSAAGIFAAARTGDPSAIGFLEALGRINGRGISDVIVAYDPSRRSAASGFSKMPSPLAGEGEGEGDLNLFFSPSPYPLPSREVISLPACCGVVHWCRI